MRKKKNQINPFLKPSQIYRKRGFRFTDKELTEFDKLMKEHTHYDLDYLRRNFDFRFSGALVVVGDQNGEDSVLTEISGGRHKLMALPGGKMNPIDIPFSMLRFAKYWGDNHHLYESNIIPGSNVSLMSFINNSNESEIKRLIDPLDNFAARIDTPFTFPEIRMEGYREFDEEFGFGIPREFIDEDRKRKRCNLEDLIPRERISTGQSGKLIYALTAKPISIFMERYRLPAQDGEDVIKKGFISFNYLIDLRWANYKQVKDHIRKAYKEKEEIKYIRWTPFYDLSFNNSSRDYHNSVIYVAKRLEAQGVVSLRPGFGVGEDFVRDDDKIIYGKVVAETFDWEKSK